MSDLWNQLVLLANANNGHVTAKQAVSAGISRTLLMQYVKEEKLTRVCRGHYIITGEIADEYALLQSRSSHLVFSHGTALFIWGLSDRIPHILDVSVPQSVNVSKLKSDHPDVHFHYVRKDLFDIGKTESLSPHGNNIILYDKERCICDLIKARKSTDMQLYSQAIKDYFSHECNVRKLIKYGRLLGIEDKIRTYTEVML